MDEAASGDLLEEMPAVYRPSPYWEQLSAQGIRQLREGGFENFKRSVNMRYFNWGVLGIVRHQLLPVIRRWLQRPDIAVFRAQFPDYGSRLAPGVTRFNAPGAFVYRVYAAMLWEYVAREDPLRLLRTLEEPPVGNPFAILYKGARTSQDVCNSVHEFYQSGGLEMTDGQRWNVAELGAGYGRLAYVFLRALPAATYSIIDIPPALNLAQEYLTRVLPEERVFRFRRFRHYEDVREEFQAARIRFLAAHQIELLPAKEIDLFLNISSLHEMTLAQIQNYLTQIDRVCRGRFYTKQWRVSRARANGLVIREAEYPVPRSWRCLYRRRHPIQRMFFEALYQT